MSTLKFRIAAKTDVGLVRTNNEDNFQAASDLSSKQMHWVNNEICSLSDKGALLVVADGMGGMNAGEVASALAIETIKDFFTPDKLTQSVIKDRFSVEKFMKEAIIAADERIKRKAKDDPETRGMGTTIVIGWILKGKLYVSWCGDSRAYVYNPAVGLHQITKDHSYVQGLVDKGIISKEDAFDYPDNNIVTRSLSDATIKVKPESLLKPYDLCDNDIVLLCTDGLSGMIRDYEMEDVIRKHEQNMIELTDALIKAACDASGADNITICLCQILKGGGVSNSSYFKNLSSQSENCGHYEKISLLNKIVYSITLFLFLALLISWGWFMLKKDKSSHKPLYVKFVGKPTVDKNDNLNCTIRITSIYDSTAKTRLFKDSIASIVGTANVDRSIDIRLPDKPTYRILDKKEDNNSMKEKDSKKQENKKNKVEKKVEETKHAKPEDELNSMGRLDASLEADKSDNKVEKDTTAKNVKITEDADSDTDKYKVKNGETIFSVSKKYGISQEKLKELNKGIIKGDRLNVGQVINVPKLSK